MADVTGRQIKTPSDGCKTTRCHVARIPREDGTDEMTPRCHKARRSSLTVNRQRTENRRRAETKRCHSHRTGKAVTTRGERRGVTRQKTWHLATSGSDEMLQDTRVRSRYHKTAAPIDHKARMPSPSGNDEMSQDTQSQSPHHNMEGKV